MRKGEKEEMIPAFISFLLVFAVAAFLIGYCCRKFANDSSNSFALLAVIGPIYIFLKWIFMDVPDAHDALADPDYPVCLVGFLTVLAGMIAFGTPYVMLRLGMRLNDWFKTYQR